MTRPRVFGSALADALGERLATADDVQLLLHDMDAFRTEMRQAFQCLRAGIRLGGMIVIATGILLAANFFA